MWTTLLGLLLVSANAAPKNTFAVYPEQKISLNGVTEMKIIGVRGHLHLTGTAGGRVARLRVRHSSGPKYDDWHLSVERRGKVLYLEVFNVAYGAQWRKWVREEFWPTFDIELSGAALPTTVNWRDGQISIENWNANLEIAFLKGRAEVQGGRGRLRLQPAQAEVAIENHTGEVSIRGESGNISLARNRGALNLSWLTGNLLIRECSGHMKVETGSGNVKILGGHGDVDLQMARGVARLASFDGRVRGRTEAVNWDLSAAAPADVNISNASGPVGLRWMAGGARVFLSSARGPIEVQHADFLNRENQEGHQVVHGVKAAKKMGQVFVHTDSGAIRWRQ